MAILQPLIALLSRSVGRMLSAVFGWAVVALFGDTDASEKTWLSALVAAAAAWPLLILGVIWPRVATFVLAFAPLPEWVPSGVIRGVWIVLALAVPIVLGVVFAARARGVRPPIPGSRMHRRTVASSQRSGSTPDTNRKWIRLLRGFPLTIGLAIAFFIVFVTVPVRRMVAILRRRIEVQVPLVTDAESYHVVADEIATTLNASDIPVQSVEPPWWMTAPGRVLVMFGGATFRDYVPDRLVYLKGASLDAYLYPNSLAINGPAQGTAWAHGVLVEALTAAPAYQTFNPGAQDIERQIRSVWAVYRENPPAHRDAARLRSRVNEIARDIRRLPVEYEEWQIVYRQALQLDRVLRGESQLLEVRQGKTRKDVEEAERDDADEDTEGNALRRCSVRELLQRVRQMAAVLAQKEVQLARAEAKADLESELAVAKGLGVAGILAVLGLSAALTAGILWMAASLPGWVSGLGVFVILLAVSGGLAYWSWSRRVVLPLLLTRRSVRETAEELRVLFNVTGAHPGGSRHSANRPGP